MNPTETDCCRRCQSDSGTWLCVESAAQETHTHWLNPTPTILITSCPHTGHVSTCCTWNDIRCALCFILIFLPSRERLLLCCLSELYSMKHVTHTLFHHPACVIVHTHVFSAVHQSHYQVYALFLLVIYVSITSPCPLGKAGSKSS